MPTPRKLAPLAAVLVAAVQVTAAAEPAALEEIVRRVVSRVDSEDTAVQLAEGQLRHLENQGKLRIGFRPQFGLLSFSNPAMLAAAIGGGLTFGRPTAPSKFDMLNARLDLLEAELSREQVKVRSELRAVRQFFDLLSAQQVAEKACSVSPLARARLQKVSNLVEAKRLTQLDEISYEMTLLDHEARCVQAEADQQAAAVRLAALVGVTDPDSLHVADVDLPASLSEAALASLESLLEPAFLARPAAASIRDRADEIARETLPGDRFRFEFFSPSFLSNGGIGQGSGTALGAKALRGEFGVEYFAGGKADGEAQRQIIAARLRRLQQNIQQTQTEIRAEVQISSELARAALARERISRRKLELVLKSREALERRMDAGLATVAARFPAEEVELGVQQEHARAVNDLKAGLYSVAFVTGIEDRAAERLDSLISRRTTAWKGKSD